MLFQPATPVLSDLLGARIVYVHAEPYRQPPMIETGTVILYRVRANGDVQMLVKPDKPHLITRWREESHLLNYLPQEQTAIAVAIAAA